MVARSEENQKQHLYRIYVTDSLKAIGGLDRRYVEFLEPPKVETRTSEEIIDHIKEGLSAL